MLRVYWGLNSVSNLMRSVEDGIYFMQIRRETFVHSYIS